MKTVFGPYENGLIRIGSQFIEFKEKKAIVSDELATFLLSRPGYTLHPHSKCVSAKNILIVRNNGLGDVLFCTVLPKFFKKINKDCSITFATFPRNFRVVQNNPDINHTIHWNDVKENLGNYDYICNLDNYFEHGFNKNQENIMHRVDMLKMAFSHLPEIKEWDNDIYYRTTDDEKEYAKNILEKYKGKKIISFFPQATELTRRYPDCNGLTNYLANKGYAVIVMSPGGERFKEHSNILNLAGKTTISQFAAIIEASNLTITPDSGPLHLAGALDKKIITFFNSFPPLTRTRYYKHCFAFTAEETCPSKRYPCGYAHCPALCLKKISFETVYEKVKEMVGK